METKELNVSSDASSLEMSQKTEEKELVTSYYEAESWQFSGCGD